MNEKKNLLRVGYFAQNEVKVSTTFIYDLIKGLQNDHEIDLFAYHGGLTKLDSSGAIGIGYTQKHAALLNKIRLFVPSMRFYQRFSYKYRKRLAVKLLDRHIEKDLDIAYVDFATAAIYLMDFFKGIKLPFVVHVHGYDISKELHKLYYREELLCLFQSANKFIAASEYIKRRLILLGCESNKIEVINYGIDPINVEIYPWQKRLKESPSLIFLGRLTPKKNPLALIYAFRIVKNYINNARLTIIGDGELWDDMKYLISKLGLTSSITMHGALDREKSFPIMREHWIYVQHSVTPISGDIEGFAISLAEAALHELPVVSTIHNGIPEHVIDGKTGYLIPEYDYGGMADRIIELIKQPHLAEQFGKAGRDRVINNLKPSLRILRIKEMMKKLVAHE